jgi:DNA-binding transcriptional LysR family regulator
LARPTPAVIPYLQVETFVMGIEAVLGRLCVGILPRFFVNAEIAAGALATIGRPVKARPPTMSPIPSAS